MQNGLNINLYIPDRLIDGLMIVSSPNWTGQCIKAKRGNFDVVTRREEVRQKSGIYFLFGYDERDQNLVYVGESEDVISRLIQHVKSDDKSWFEEMVVFTTSNNFLTKGHIRNIEYELINQINKSINYKIRNSNNGSDSPLPENMKSDVLTFIEYVKLIMPILGFNVFDGIKSERLDSFKYKSLQNYYMNHKSNCFKATGNYDDINGKFIVLKDSIVRSEETESCVSNIKMNRQRLVEQGIIENNIFIRDYEFNSPSMAAAIVFGGSQNGWVSWKTKDGKTLDEVIRKNISQIEE